MTVVWASMISLDTPSLFYKALTKLQNLETLAMRKKCQSSHGYTPQAALQEVLAIIYSNSRHEPAAAKSYLKDLLRYMVSRGYPLGNASDPFGLGFNPLEKKFPFKDWA